MSKYDYNKDYFNKIDSHEKAYWLGFLYADGCITRFYKNDKLKSMSLEITLCNNDKEHLEKFKKSLQSNVPIREKIVTLNNGKTYISNRININCTKMCYDLIKLGCVPNKTFEIEMPNNSILPDIYVSSFIRGFFDGDGCISVTKMNNKPHIVVTITGIEKMLSGLIQKLINEKIIRIRNPKIHHDTRSSACSFYLYGDIAKEFLDYIYENSEIHLDRKYNKYIEFYKNYCLDNYHGVNWSNRNKAYVVTIYMNGKRIRIGQSKDLNEAINMRKDAEYEKMNQNKQPT